jgi:hypothetical protein
MKIEIVEFYKNEKNSGSGTLKGTLHAFFPDDGIDLRGIPVSIVRGRVWIGFPSRQAYDPDEKKVVTYPIISFLDQKKQTAFRKSIVEEGRKFLEKKLGKTVVAEKKKYLKIEFK